jgi:hypothetical protein
MLVLSRYAAKVGISTYLTVFTSTMPAVKRRAPSILVREMSRGQGDRGGWPSTTGNPSGDGRSNNPPKNTEKDRDSRGRYIKFNLYKSDQVDENFDETVTCIACGGRATIMLLENGSTVWTNGQTTKLYIKLYLHHMLYPSPEYVAMGSQNRYYVKFEDREPEWVGCDDMTNSLKETNRSVNTIAFGERWDSYFIIYEDGWWEYHNIPDSLVTILEDRGRKVDLDCVSLGPDGEYYMRAKNGQAWWGGTSKENFSRISEDSDRVMFVDFADDDTFLCRYT